MDKIKLDEIMNDHIQRKGELSNVAMFLIKELNNIKGVHATNYRIKDEKHLIEKIQRKNNNGRNITIDNYKKEITDLIGIRILHIFKDDWKEIDYFIRNNYKQVEKPKAYIRAGDDTSNFSKKYFKIEEHNFGYRSLHYVMKTTMKKNIYIIEFQVRTIFEEAWGEIDHFVRYPNNTEHTLLNLFTKDLNRLAGLGDEMALNIRELKNIMDINKNEIEKKDATIKNEIEKRDLIIVDLLNKVNISNREKGKLRKKITNIENKIKQEQITMTNIGNNRRPYFSAECLLKQLENNNIKYEQTKYYISFFTEKNKWYNIPIESINNINYIPFNFLIKKLVDEINFDLDMLEIVYLN